jgi:hypothetical protein
VAAGQAFLLGQAVGVSVDPGRGLDKQAILIDAGLGDDQFGWGAVAADGDLTEQQPPVPPRASWPVTMTEGRRLQRIGHTAYDR